MMRFTSLITIFLIFTASLFAQAPEKFTYQAVVRNANNSLVINAQVGVRVNILQGSTSGVAVYSESHVASTNANGLITVSIGGGSVLHGSFAGIDWSDGPYFLKTDIDPNGGNDYTITSTQQLLSVPYALYAKEAGNSFSGDYNDLTNTPQIPTVPDNVSAFTNDAGYITAEQVPAQVNADWNATTGAAQILNKPTLFSGDYNDLTNKPVLFSGNYNDLTNKPVLFSGNYNDLTNKPNLSAVAYSGSYNDLINKPSIPAVMSDLTNNVGYITLAQVPAQVNSDWNATSGAAQILNKPTLFSGNYNDLTNKPVLFSGDYNDLTNLPQIPQIPADISAFNNDAGYLTSYTETDPQFNAWDKDYNDLTNKPVLFSGDYNDLANKPTIPTVPANVSAFTNDAGYLTSFTEQQVLSISNDTLFLTGGSFVKLPAGFDGDYNSLTNKPEIPTTVGELTNDANYITIEQVPAQVNADWNATEGAAQILNKPTLFSGDYNDLTNLPQIPQIPADISAFNNDAGYLTNFTEQQVLSISNDTLFLTGGSFVKLPAGFDGDYNSLTNKPAIPTVPTNVSAFTNDAGYLTEVAPQTLSLSGDELTISGGNTVTIPVNSGAPGRGITNIEGPVSEGLNDTYTIHYTDGTTSTFVVKNGAAGVNGADGTNGTNGVNGTDGVGIASVSKTATNGNVDTYTISYTDASTSTFTVTNGVDGIDGTDGEIGPEGPVGPEGPAGVGIASIVKTGEDDNTDIYTITYTDESTSQFSVTNGVNGQDGISPTVTAEGQGSNVLITVTDGSGTHTYTIPTTSGEVTQQPADWTATSGVQMILNKPSLATVAETGDYNDLENLPLIPTNVSELTNDADFVTIYDIPEIPTVPENVSAFNNDAGYITSADIPEIPTVPENVSAFNNDAGYITSADIPEIPTVPENVSAFVNDAGYLTSFTEQQVLSISNDTLFLTGGSFVKLPAGFDGDYNSLTNKPTIPTVPTDVSAFSNDAGYITSADIPEIPTVPENVSVFNNDAGYITSADIPEIPTVPENVSVFNNDAGYITSADIPEIPTVPENVSVFNNDAGYITSADIPEIPTVPENVSAFNNDANYITNTSSCSNNVDLCDLLNRLETLENQQEPIMVQTEGVTAVSQQSFTVNGKVFASGSSTVSQRGFVYGVDHNPSINNNSVNSGSGNGSFTSTITGLDAGITYYVRAFATNDNGTFYGSEVAVTTTATTPSTLPSVTTIAVTNISINEATVKGSVTSDGGENVTQRGFVYDTLSNPTTSSTVAYHGTGVGQFSNLLSGLLSGKTYYVRAFATNSVGTAYGNEISFTTNVPSPVAGDAIPCPETPTVTDHEGNVYNTVKIGAQCWTKENLRTTTSPSTGTYLIPPAGTEITHSGKQARWFNNDSATYAPKNCGLLYNWNAAMDTFNTMYGETSVNPNFYEGINVDVEFIGHRRGICPQGWHVPSNDEWTQLTDYLKSHEEYCKNGISDYIASSLASTTDWYMNDWEDCIYCPGHNPTDNNLSGFTAIPAGVIGGDQNEKDFSRITAFWSSTQFYWYGECALNLIVGVWDPAVIVTGPTKNSLLSVRCLRDETSGGGSSALLPTVTTIAVTNITTNGATVQGEVTFDGDENVTERGICWCTTDQGNPTLEHNHVVAGSGTGTFNATIDNLTDGHYHVCAYATNAMGTAYGNVLSITICNENTTSGLPCPLTPTVTDYEGHIYNTVMIGEQCWMRENLRSLHYADGTQIDYGAYESSYYPNTVYYLDVALMNGTESSNNIPSGVQGPCPNGWHLPSKAEWEVMISYVSNQFSCYADSLSILYASPEGWPGHNGNLNPGYNRTGFSATPSGSAYYGAIEGEVNYSVFSSCTRLPDPSDFYVFNVNIDENRAEIAGGHAGWCTVAVRCLRDIPCTDEIDTTGGGNTPIDTTTTPVDTTNTSYGIPCPNDPTVTDYDGNVYNTVKIGEQCWMRENLRTTHYTDGTEIPVGTHWANENGEIYRYIPGSDTTMIPITGYTYTTRAAVRNSSSSDNIPSGTQGICPTGWHVPSPGEWNQLLNYVRNIPENMCGTMEAKALANKEGWNVSTVECTPGYNQNENNITGFSARSRDGGGVRFMTSSYYSSNMQVMQYIIHPNSTGLQIAYSYVPPYIRCLRDIPCTDEIDTTGGGNTPIDTTTTPVDTTSTSYGIPCPGVPTVTDHEGNVYHTVQIGNQCWTKENLRTTTSPSTGTYLISASGTNYTYTGKQAFWYYNDSTTYAPMNYGLLYNWNAAVDTFNTAYGETSVNTSSSNAVSVTFNGHRRGICPVGWHLPSDAEWNTMEATVSGSDWQTSYETSTGYRGSHAGKLAGGDNWTTSITSGAPGDYDDADRNVSGFSAVPAGRCGGSSFGNAGNFAYFWSSSQYGSYSYYAYYRFLDYDFADVYRYYCTKEGGRSVRCLRD